MPVQGFIQNPIFMPAGREIVAITNAFPAQVTTSFDHGYITGAKVSLYVPKYYGMEQVNHMQGSIQVTGTTTFLIDIDTRPFDPFVVPAPNPNQTLTPAQVVPVGEDNDTLLSAFMNILQPLF